MNTSSSQTLLNAALYSAKMHRQQRRKGASAEPYINHCIEVAQVLADLGGVRDTELLCAALLHDTVEDTEASPQDILDRFGPEVASIVAEVTDDKSLPRADRKRLQIEHAPHKSDQAKQLKLADKLCNVRDLVHDPPDDWDQERILGYFDWAEKVVAGLRGSNLPIEAEIDHWLQAGRATFNAAAT